MMVLKVQKHLTTDEICGNLLLTRQIGANLKQYGIMESRLKIVNS
jgi:hypothetical protein